MFPADALAATHAVVVGVGSVGRRTALALAQVGVARLSLFDPDTVGEENLGTQGWDQADADARTAKADAAAAACVRLNPAVRLTACQRPLTAADVAGWGPDLAVAVFLCTDSIPSRRAAFTLVRGAAKAVFDARMLSAAYRVYAVPDPAGPAGDWYEGTLPEDDEVQPGRCTASRSLAFTAGFAADTLVALFSQLLVGNRPPRLVASDAVTFDAVVEPWPDPAATPPARDEETRHHGTDDDRGAADHADAGGPAALRRRRRPAPASPAGGLD